MEKCIGPLFNGDTIFTERICLMIDNCILLLEHPGTVDPRSGIIRGTYNFPGGKIPLDLLEMKPGITSLKELIQEIGLYIEPHNLKIRLISWYYHHDCIRLLFFAKVKRKHLKFIKASHVWEIKSFTLVPLSGKCIELGEYIEQNIRKANNKCARYIRINEDFKLIYEDMGDNLFKKDNYIYKKLNDFEIKDDNLMREINKKITGYNDTKDIYTDDYICKIKYISYKNIKYTISYKFFKNLKFAYKTKSSYNKVIRALYNNNVKNNIIFIKDNKRYNYIQNFKLLFDKLVMTKH